MLNFATQDVLDTALNALFTIESIGVDRSRAFGTPVDRAWIGKHQIAVRGTNGAPDSAPNA